MHIKRVLNCECLTFRQGTSIVNEAVATHHNKQEWQLCLCYFRNNFLIDMNIKDKNEEK